MKIKIHNNIVIVVLAIVVSLSAVPSCFLVNDLLTFEKRLETTNEEINIVSGQLTEMISKLQEVCQNIQYLKNRSKYNLHDPTYDEAYNFILNDTTDGSTYNDSSYNCAHFSRDVNNNAEKQGIRTAYVEIKLRGQPHAIVAFNTTDAGLVFFEPQSDELVELEIGKDYWAECVVVDSPDYGYNPFNIVESFTLYW